MSNEKTVFDRLVIADEQGHLQGKPLEGVTAAITAAVEKDREAHQDIEPERIAKAQGVWLVRSETEPPETMHGVPVIWVDTSNSAAAPSETSGSGTPQPAPKPVVKQVTPPPPVFHGEAKTYTIPAVTGVKYLVGDAEVSGTVTVQPPMTVRVVAEPQPGYAFPVGAPASWSFEFEAASSPFDDAVLPLTSYLRLDDATDATTPRDRGTSPLTISTKYSGIFTPGAPGIGIGATSARVTGAGNILAQFNPSDIRAYTTVSVHKINREHTQLVTLSSLWSGSMPSLTVLTAKGSSTAAVVNFQNAVGAKTTNVAPAPALADGDIVVMVQTWDGTTIHGYVNGVEIVSIPWAGSTSTNDALKLINWSAPGGEINIAGLGFQKGEAKSSEWVSAAYEAAKRGAAV